MSGSSSSGLVGFTEILLVTSYQRWVEYSKTVQYKKKVQKLSLGQYSFERYTFVPYLPQKGAY